MVTPELLSYITEQMAAGFTAEQLKPALESAGWQADMIAEAFAQIAPTPAKPSIPEPAADFAPATTTNPIAEQPLQVTTPDTSVNDAMQAVQQAAAMQMQQQTPAAASPIGTMESSFEPQEPTQIQQVATPAVQYAQPKSTGLNTPVSDYRPTSASFGGQMAGAGATPSLITEPVMAASKSTPVKKSGSTGFIIEVIMLVIILLALIAGIIYIHTGGFGGGAISLKSPF